MKRTITFRQIKNGYIQEESRETKDGYQREEIYVKTLPKAIADKISNDERSIRTDAIASGLKKK